MAISRWQQVAKIMEKIAAKLSKIPDLTFFAWLDSYLGPYLTPAISNRLFPYVWSGLYFQPPLRKALKYQQIRRGILDPFGVLKSGYCPGVAVLDEGIADKLQGKIAKPVIAFPDFTDESPPDLDWKIVKDVVAKAEGKRIISLLGSLSQYKGLLTFVEISRQVPEGWLFVFAGDFATTGLTSPEIADIKSFFGSEPQNCFFYLKRIPGESQFNALVKISDVLFAVRDNFPFSSNTLIKAACFQKPVIASQQYCIGERVEKFHLGYTLEEADVAKCVKILGKLPMELATNNLSIRPDFEGYYHRHSLPRLREAFQELLRLL
jgi:glycosyltransferase involved in cell wall biosynthesis